LSQGLCNLGFACELLADGDDRGRHALRLEGCDQVAQPGSQIGRAERFIIGQSPELAEQLAEAAQPVEA
jgi:hypothetical protein